MVNLAADDVDYRCARIVQFLRYLRDKWWCKSGIRCSAVGDVPEPPYRPG
jgi:hypothetical protein